eukprot:1932601-Prymnesium_polylepis.1
MLCVTVLCLLSALTSFGSVQRGRRGVEARAPILQLPLRDFVHDLVEQSYGYEAENIEAARQRLPRWPCPVKRHHPGYQVLPSADNLVRHLLDPRLGE